MVQIFGALLFPLGGAHLVMRARHSKIIFQRKPIYLPRICAPSASRPHRNFAGRLRTPVMRRKHHIPDVVWFFHLHAYLEKLPQASRPLYPRHTRTHACCIFLRITRRNFQRYPGIFWKVMLRGVTATLKTQILCRRAFFKWLTQQIDSANYYRPSLFQARTTSALLSQLRRCCFRQFPPPSSVSESAQA